MDISIIIPAYNEESRIAGTLNAYSANFSAMYDDRWELLVILNGCTDKTEEVVTAAGRNCSAIRAIVYKEKLGKGGAILQGLRAAVGEAVAFVDADNMVPPLETAKLLKALETHDVAIGWRRADLALAPKPPPWIRRMASMVLPMWVRYFLNLRYQDPQCGAKAMRKSAVIAMLPLLREHGWALDLSLLMAANDLGLAVIDIPVSWMHVDEGSKVQLRQASWEVFLASWRLKLYRQRPKKGEG